MQSLFSAVTSLSRVGRAAATAVDAAVVTECVVLGTRTGATQVNLRAAIVSVGVIVIVALQSRLGDVQNDTCCTKKKRIHVR